MTWTILIALGVLLAWPFFIENRRTAIGRSEREDAPGNFAKLTQGVTYYRWFGPTRGPVIVAIHGLTTPSIAFEALASGLGKLGYRVLTYDLYGRGLSDAPHGAQNAAFFHRQLNDLLADQGLTDNLTVMGYSMGGSIAATFAAAQPDRIKRVILLASAGVMLNESGFARFCRATPIIGDWVFMAFANRQMTASIKMDAEHFQASEVPQAQLAELKRQGFLKAVLSSRRNMLAESTETAHRSLGIADIPVVAIWGRRDTVIPIAALGQLTQWNRNTLQEVVEDADHGLPISHAAEVATVLRDVLREPS